jgi:hypothetical protein
LVARAAIGAVGAMSVLGPAHALDGVPYAHRRTIELASSGFARLLLPDDVLDACRAGLADVRVVGSDGQDLPYAIEPLPEPHLRWLVRDVEHVPGVETTAVVDRGIRPVDIDAVTLEIGGEADFLKPVAIEVSDDRAHWKELARGSVFAASQPVRVRMTRISFPPNDRRYLRLRLNDKNGAAVDLTSVSGHGASTGARDAAHAIRVAAAPAAEATPGASTYAIELPAAHLGIVGLRLESTSPAFARDVRVYDRIVYRGEVSRRLIGAAHLVRGAAGEDETIVPIADPTGRTLEIEIARGGGHALADVAFVATVTPTAIVFHAPTTSGFFLYYGSTTARSPGYDLAEALRRGLPREIIEARLGADVVTADSAPDAAAGAALVARFGTSVDPAQWRTRRRIRLPAAGPVAFVGVDDRPEQLAALRIVDRENRQVPYLVEREPRLRMAPAAFGADEKRAGGTANDATSSLRIAGIDPTRAIGAVELDAKEPFFDREVWVEEASPRRRDRPELGDALRRTLGSARWVRLPEQTAPLRIPIAQPDESELFISFRDGAERPLTIDRVSIERIERRLDFLTTATPSLSEGLTLLSDNPAASAPSYDLALVADRIAELPAEAASLGAAESASAPSETPGSRWLWAAVLVAALGVTGMLVRTLRTALPANRDPPPP